MRQLSKIEHAFTLINQAFPMPAVIILRFKQGPTPGAISEALNNLLYRHPLLKSTIEKRNKEFWFQPVTTDLTVPFQTINRTADNYWLAIAQEEINKRVELSAGPLIKSKYLFANADNQSSELILTINHVVADAEWLVAMINELLTQAGQGKNTSVNTDMPTATAESPLMESLYPSSFKGFKKVFRMIPFIAKQLMEEIKYKIDSKKIKDPPIPPTSKNNILTIAFSEESTTALVKWSRKKRLSLNGIITAAYLLVVNKHYYQGKRRLMRSMHFANLRPSLSPPVPANIAGAYVSMMRFMVAVSTDLKPEEIARSIDNKINRAVKKGDKFLFALMSKMLIKETLRKYNSRVSSSLFSYAGPIQLKENYGNIQLSGVHAFVANNHLGPVISSFGKICFGKLSLDVNFLTDEVPNTEAVKLALEIKLLLEELTTQK